MTKKKIIEINTSFKARLEMFMLKKKLFGIGGYYGVKWEDFKELIKPKKLECLYG